MKDQNRKGEEFQRIAEALWDKKNPESKRVLENGARITLRIRVENKPKRRVSK